MLETQLTFNIVSSWLGIVVVHQLNVTWGVNGTMTYSAANVKLPTMPLIAYSATHDMGSSASIKVMTLVY